MGITANREIIIKTADGRSIVLTGKDKIESTTTHVVVCDGPKCASRNGIKEPKQFTFELEKAEKGNDAFPPEADQFLSLMLPFRSPSNAGVAVPLCSVQCVKDYLTYVYMAPGPRVQTTDIGSVPLAEPETVELPVVISQGAGE